MTRSDTMGVDPATPARRWGQLALGVLAMVMIANMQYGWTLFVGPMQAQHGWSRAAIQVAFTIFIVAETWLLPIEGWLIDRFGPRATVFTGGLLVAAGWSMNAVADSLALLYVAAAVGGAGAGFVYAASVGNALAWFPDRRGLAAGITAAGFGGGSALTILPIAWMIEAHGYQATFLWFGLGQGAVLLLASLAMRKPAAGEVPVVAAQATPAGGAQGSGMRQGADWKPGQVLRSPLFWVLYAMFVMVCAGGLMATAQLAPIAHDFGIANTPVSILGLTLPALTFALSIDRVLNGLTRPFFGWVSDHLGRENTMFGAFLLEGIGILALMHFGADPVLFVVLTGLVFFAWGEIYSLFPALCTDLYGRSHATTNYGMLYTAKGTAALLVPLSSVLQQVSGGWEGVFLVAATCNIAAAVLAIAVVKPLRRRAAGRIEAPVAAPAVA
ncbi:oxalate/formate MFS antiporter [Roseomonas sp. NAR14]|uniref:Oxalate/formate MFS antiporter n=1 Tax=Roseomonas acroporae TaxID=2937791 RepID=A0A9X1YFD1_9PROT|nr:oxalate/formate MFS antiporter [Roseomonas acroporae]MCK8788105.1 oxalate/formate MFS antiporter [Roseomonas acroporae]